MPSTPRHDNELTRTQCGGVLRFAVQKEDRGRAIDDENDLVADRVAFPFAVSGPVSNEYCAVSVGSQAGECAGRPFVGAGRCSVWEKRECFDRLMDRDGDRLCHVSRLCATPMIDQRPAVRGGSGRSSAGVTERRLRGADLCGYLRTVR